MSIINQNDFQRDLDFLVKTREDPFTEEIERKSKEFHRYFDKDPEYLFYGLMEELGSLPNDFETTIYYIIKDGKRITTSTPSPYSVIFKVNTKQ